MMQPPKRKSTTTDSPRRTTKKTKIAADGQITFPKQGGSSSVTPSSRTVRIQNAKPGPSSQTHEPATPCRTSSRVSRPSLKRKALLSNRRSRSLESDGTPPSTIIPPAPPPSLKLRKQTSSPIKKPGGNNTPSKSKCLDKNPIELTSDDSDSRAQPPQKRVKRTHKKPLKFEVIDLCSESGDVTSSPTHPRTRDEGSVVVILSTDEEVDIEFRSCNRLGFRETDARKSPALPPLRNTSPPIEDESMLQVFPSPQTCNTPGAPVTEDIFAGKVDFPRGSLQSLYNEALARSQAQHANDIIDQPSPFASLKGTPQARIIRYPTQSQSPTLHTPLFFHRIILRSRTKLKQLKTLDVKTSLDATNVSLGSVNEEQEVALASFNTVTESSAIDTEVPDVATKTVLVPPIDSQDDSLSNTQATHIISCIPINDMDVTEGPMSKAPEPPSLLGIRESPLPPEVDIPKDTSILSQEVSANRRTATPERTNPSVISPNMLSSTPSYPSNLDPVNYQIETPQEAETVLFRREPCAYHAVLIEPSVLKDAQFLVQALRRRRFGASKISEPSLPPALESNDDTTKPPVAPETLSELPLRTTGHTTTTDTSSLTTSSSEDTSSTSRCPSESPMIPDHAIIPDISPHSSSSTDHNNASSTSKFSETLKTIIADQVMTLNISSLAGSSSEDASSNFKCLPELLAMPAKLETLPSLSSLASGDTFKQESLIRSNSSPSSVVVSFLDMDLSNLNLRKLMGNSKFDQGDDDDDDDDISISGMELVYPEEVI